MEDFLSFKQYEVSVKAEQSAESGGWDITLRNDYSSGEVKITLRQLQEINKQIFEYINANMLDS